MTKRPRTKTQHGIFLSSTNDPEVRKYRLAARDIIEEAEFREHWYAVEMDKFTPDTLPPVDVCKEYVLSCLVYVGLLGPFWGTKIKDQKISYTEYEYQVASEAVRKIAIFILPDDPIISNSPSSIIKGQGPFFSNQENFKKRVHLVHTPRSVTDLDNFKDQFRLYLRDLKNLQINSFDIPSINPVSGTQLMQSFDRQSVYNCSITDLDEGLLDKYLNSGMSQSIQAGSNLEHLQKLDVSTRAGELTLGLLLCLGNREALSGMFSACELHLVVYNGTEKISRNIYKKEFKDNLVSLYQVGMRFFEENAGLMRIGEIGTSERDELEIPKIVLREALANALIHRNYEDHEFREQPTRLEVYQDRIEIISFGGLVKGITEDSLNTFPINVDPLRRNPIIAKIFMHMGIVELGGSGISRMHETMRSFNLPQPEITQYGEELPRVRVTLRRKRPKTSADLFICHANSDDEVTNKISEKLADSGITTWIDHRDAIGSDGIWHGQISEAIQMADAGLFVISTSSIKSVYCESEWHRILSLGKRLYIVLIEPIPLNDIPFPLATIQYADLSKNWDGGLTELTQAIHNVNKPSSSPIQFLSRIIGYIDNRLTTIPITGRDYDLNEMKRLLKLAPVAILGVGGLGKSRLAAELALTSPDVDGTVWHTVSNISRPDEVIELLRDHFNLEVTADRSAVLKKLRMVKRLIVLDNAESVPADDPRRAAYVQLIDDLADAGAQVLLTSRVEWPDLGRCGTHTPRTLTPDSAAQVVLYMGEALGVQADLQTHAASIAHAARFHPRLIEWTVGLMKKFPVAKVLADLTDLRSKGAQDALDEMILKTLRQMTEAHGDQPAAVLKRLNVCRGGFTYPAAQALTAPPDNPDSASVLSEETDLDDSLSTLQTYRFVTFDGTRYTIDPLVIAAVGEDPAAHRPHYDYYYALADHHDNKQDYLGLDPESANLETAFEWALATGDGEKAYWIANPCATFLANRGRFAQRKDWLDRVANSLEQHRDTNLKVNAQITLGLVYQEHPFGSRRENLRRAVASYQTALEYLTPAVPLIYAQTKNNLGAAYWDLSKIEDRADNLHRAIDCYQAALQYRTPSTAPLAYAQTQNNLAIAYRNLAEIEDRAPNLHRAIACYQAALEYQTATAAPLAYAQTQNNLAIAYRNLAEIEDRPHNLQQAIARYQAALEYRTPTTAPLAYAQTQNNLGAAYSELAVVEDRADNLNRAIVCYHAALEYQTPAAAPLAYAQTQNNLGAAYRDLARIQDRADNLNRAIVCYHAALEYQTPAAAPLAYAQTQNNLGTAYWDLAGIQDRADNLNNAIACYQAALEYRTPSAAPIGYAMTQANLGNAYQDLDNLPAAIACWREAEIYYRQMDAIEDADLMLEWIADAEAKLKG